LFKWIKVLQKMYENMIINYAVLGSLTAGSHLKPKLVEKL